MTIPVEVFVWLGGGYFALLTFTIHLLIGITRTLGRMDKAAAVAEVKYAALERHTERNDQEMDAIKRNFYPGAFAIRSSNQ